MEYPKDWKLEKLENLGEIYTGGTPDTNKPEYWDGDILWFTPTEVSKGEKYLEDSIRKITAKGLKDSSAKLFPEKTLMICTRATIGEISISQKPGCTNQGFKNILPNKENSVEYLYYQLLNHKKQLIINSCGSTFLELSTTDFRKFKIPIPKISEQVKIAGILSKWDELIEAQTQLINTKEKQKTSLMQKLLTGEVRFPGFKDEWKILPIGKLTKIYDGTHSTPTYTKFGIPFYSVESITQDDFTNTKFISEEVFEKENKRVKLERGDILMTRIGDIGTAKMLSWDVKASFYVSLALIKKSDKFNSKYLEQYIESNLFQSELHKRTIHVAFPKKINLGEINACLVKLPSIKEQEKIADVLNFCDEEIKSLKTELEAWKIQKKGLMQQLLTGKIRVKV